MAKETVVINVPTEIDEGCAEIIIPSGGAVNSDAIIKARSLYFNSYDLGNIQGLRRSMAGIAGNWTIVSTGGRLGFGYATSIKNVNPTGGQYDFIPCFLNAGNPSVWGTIENHPVQSGCTLGINLFGQTLLNPMNCIGWGTTPLGFGDYENPQLVISILPSLKIQASIIVLGVLQAIQVSTVTVPSNGWFALEPQIAISKQDNDRSGFVTVQLYTEANTPLGVEAIRALNVKTRSLSSSDVFTTFAYGTEVVPTLGPGLDGIGFDDVHLYGAYGTIKRLMYDNFIGVGLPSADGDLIQSTISYDSTHPNGLSADNANVGGPVTHGEATRVNNLSGGPTRPNLDEHTYPTSNDENPAPPGNQIQLDFNVGSISPFTGNWLSGPFTWPGPEITRNTFNDNQTDTYKLKILRNDIIQILGVAPIVGTTQRYVDSTYSVAGGGSATFNWTGLHGHSIREANALVRVGLRLNGISDIGRYFWSPGFSQGTPNWKPISFYTKDPFNIHEKDPSGLAWTVSSLLLTQVLVKGDTSIINTDPDPTIHWVQFDIIQAGVEYAYRNANVIINEHPPFPPIAALTQTIGTDLTNKVLVVKNDSVDWDGTIVTSVIDWGDLSSTTNLAPCARVYAGEAAPLTTASHTYTAPGTYNVTLTVTDNDGLTDVFTMSVVCPNIAPVADFTFGGAAEVVNFTDASTDVDGTVVAWDWDFGDASPHSNLQNPTHTYAGPGVYSVTLVVTDNLGATGSVSHSVTTPIGGAVRVNMPILWANSAAAGIHQFLERWDFTGGSEIPYTGGGRDGNNAVQEGTNFGVFQYTFINVNPHAFQFGFNWKGQPLPAKEVPLCMIGNQNIAIVLRPDGKVRVYAWSGAAWVQAIETVGAVPTNGPVIAQVRFRFGAAGAGNVYLWINGESLSADPIAVSPSGPLTMNGDTFTIGTGSGGNYNYAPVGGFDTGNAFAVWFDICAMDDSSATLASDNPGDVHFSICRPQAIGTFNDTGTTAVAMQSDDQATSQTSFSVNGQKDSFTVNTPAGTIVKILSVMPYYEGFRGGTIGTKTGSLFVISGATTATSPTISGSSQWTARFHVIPADGNDKWVLVHDPNTSADWANAAAVGACEVGYTAVSLNAGGTLVISQLGFEVAYWDV